MTRLFLAAGVAALAIAAPTAAKPGGGHGGQQQQAQQQQQQQQGNGGARAQHGGGGQRMQGQRQGAGGQRMQMQRQGGGGQAQRMTMQRQERQQVRAQRSQQASGFERQQMRTQRQAQSRNFERQQLRSERQAQSRNVERQQLRTERQAQGRNFERQQQRADRMQAQNRFQRQQLRQENNRALDRQQMRGNELRTAQNGNLERRQLREERIQQLREQRLANGQLNGRFARDAQLNGDAKQFVRNQQRDYWQAVNGTSFAALNYGAGRTILAPTVVERFVGVPVATVAGFTALNPLPVSMQYLYPATPDYYYRYGDGYLYQVNRGTNLIAALTPLFAGGYMPGQYLPNYYMNSYVPAYYGFNNFYPDYGDDCHRYGYGVVYEVDCYTGFVEDVIPLYAGGYGVGQMLPASYAYYNVPYQYRTMYYNTPDYNYWYAPGAIYQYDPGTSMITSVAALLSPGFAVGQPLPMGYGVYNVPYAYRDTYYDTPNAWYRYNNGYIYQVDPATQLVTAIVASLLV